MKNVYSSMQYLIIEVIILRLTKYKKKLTETYNSSFKSYRQGDNSKTAEQRAPKVFISIK